MLTRTTRATGYTLIELLVVIGILGALTGLALAGVQKARAAAARAGCASHLRQLAFATHMYADGGRPLPQGCEYPFRQPGTDPINYQCGMSWQTNTLPYLDQAELWRLCLEANRADPTGASASHWPLTVIPVPFFACPGDGRTTAEFQSNGRRVLRALTSYVGVAGTFHRRNDGAFHPNFPVRLTDFQDGTTNTLLIGERPPGPNGEFSGWYAGWADNTCLVAQILPAGAVAARTGETVGIGCSASVPSLAPGRLDDGCSLGRYWSLHPGGANFAFVDGSVRLIRYEAAELMPLLATRADGEVIPD